MTGIFDQSPDADAIGAAAVDALYTARDNGEVMDQAGRRAGAAALKAAAESGIFDPLDTATLHRLAELVDMAATR